MLKNLLYYRGLENDVLNRYFKSAEKFKASVIVRLSSDCPLIDPNLIDYGINYFDCFHIWDP